MELTGITTGIMVLIVIAIINRIKKETPALKDKDYLYTIMAFAVGAVVYCIFIYAPVVVSAIFGIGLAGSGIFDIFKSIKK